MFLNNLEDFALAMRIYSIAGQAVTQGTVPCSLHCVFLSSICRLALHQRACSRLSRCQWRRSQKRANELCPLVYLQLKTDFKKRNFRQKWILVRSDAHIFLRGIASGGPGVPVKPPLYKPFLSKQPTNCAENDMTSGECPHFGTMCPPPPFEKSWLHP